MAGVWGALTEAEIEVVNSLAQEDIPTKLRCAICSKIAANAYKLPCCEQVIDGRCHSTLPSTCPVCEHTPLSAADCNPNKSMRSTIKVFLKTETKKREAARAKEAAGPSPAPATPSEQNAPAQAVSESTEAASKEAAQVEPTADAALPNDSAAAQAENAVPDAVQAEEKVEDGIAATDEAKTEQEQPEAESVQNADAQTEDRDGGAPAGSEVVADSSAQDDVAKTGGDDQQVVDSSMNNTMNSAMNGFGFNGMDGQTPNMNFAGGDMNQMQMMMAMQNGMMPNGFSFPMMGMDPMMQNQMYMASGGFGNQGMGMNMMGGGFGGNGAGTNNWNGQQSWGGGQDNYNHPNASGMGNGDYYNTGYPQAGFNHQGNFGGPQSNPYNMNRGYGRGRGRGRGFYNGQGRGGYNNYGQNQGYNQGYQGQNQTMQQYGMNGYGQDSQTSDFQQRGAQTENAGPAANVDEYGRQLRPEATEGNENDQGQDSGAAGAAASSETKSHLDDPTADSSDRIVPAPGDPASDERVDNSGAQGTGEGAVHPKLTLDSSVSRHNGDTVYSPAIGSANSGRDGSMGPPAIPKPNVPLNAPSGPKAMRQGLPNTSLLHLRARGLVPDGKPQSPRTSEGIQSPSGDYRDSSHHADGSSRRGSESQHDRYRDRGRDRDRDRYDDSRRSVSGSSRGGSRDRDDSHRRKRQRSASVSDDERDSGRHRRSKHHHSRKSSTYDENEPKSARSRDEKHDRSRSASPDDRRSSHRSSRRERDSDKRRDRDKDRDRDGDREHRRSKSHRDRDHERDKDRDKDRDRDRKDRRDRSRDRHRERDRDRDRERDKEKDRRHRSSKKSDETPTPVEPAFNPPTGPRGSTSRSIEIKSIKGASLKTNRDQPQLSRRSSQASAATPTSGGTPVDAYAAEREKRREERLLAETKKLAGMAGLAGVKRPHEDGDDAKRNRRKRTREAGSVSVDDVNERLRKGEAERDARRH